MKLLLFVARCSGFALQLVEIMPCLDALPQLLGRPYSLEDEDAGQQAAADDVDTDIPEVAAAGPGSRQQQGYFTLDQLLQRVQVSVGAAHAVSACAPCHCGSSGNMLCAANVFACCRCSPVMQLAAERAFGPWAVVVLICAGKPS